ncbi:MAG TPA: TVP38/TMEM64 family protein [Longimicrobiales bacterium]
MAKERRIRIHPAAALAWALFLAALVLGPRLVPDEATLRAALAELGPLAPLAFVVAEVVQVVVIPIPGQPIEIPGGYLFGLVPGIALASAGAVAGSWAAFMIGRRYGRPWVETRVDARTLARFEDWLGRGHRVDWIVFWLMMIPSFPRDPLCYLAGLTPLRPSRFALIAAIGRPVGLAPWVALGAGGVALGIEFQLWLAAAAGVAWLLHEAVSRLRRSRRHRPSRILSHPSDGDADA